MEKHYLLQFEDNYADEFDAHGSVIIDEDQYKHLYLVVEQAVSSKDYSNLDEDYASDVCVLVLAVMNILSMMILQIL